MHALLPYLAFLWWMPTPLSGLSADPPVYEARRCTTPPDIDGDLSDPAWGIAPWSREFMDIRGEDGPTPHLGTRFKLLWDDEYLYLGAALEEPHLWGTLRRRDAIIYHDDDFEVFLDPDGDGEAYFEIEVNPLGTVLDLFLDRPYREGGRAVLSWDIPGLRSAVAIQGTLNDPSDQDRGWTLEMGIPWAELIPSQSGEEQGNRGSTRLPGRPGPPAPPVAGDEWRANFSRVDWPLVILRDPASREGVYRKDTTRPTGATGHPEANWVWAPQGEINMHIPQRWGVIRFVGGAPGGGEA